MIAAGAYALLFAVSFAVVSFDFAPAPDKPGDTILVDFTEPPAPEPPRPPVKTADEPRVHDVAAPEERTAQVAGKDEVTQTPNPKALFRMNKGGADEPDNAGNPRAPEGEDKASGSGPGLNPDGLDQLDKGASGARTGGQSAQTGLSGQQERQDRDPRDGGCLGQGHGRGLRAEGFDRKRRRAGRGRRRRGAQGPLHGEPCGGAGRYDHLYFPHGVNPRFRTGFRDGRPTAPDAAAVGR